MPSLFFCWKISSVGPVWDLGLPGLKLITVPMRTAEERAHLWNRRETRSGISSTESIRILEFRNRHQPIATESGWPTICSTGTGFITRCEHCMIRPFSLCSLACKRRLHLLKKANRLVHWLQVTSILSERRE